MTLAQNASSPGPAVANKDGLRGILVQVEPDEAAAGRLSAAAALAKAHGAALIGVGAESIDPFIASDPYGAMTGEWIADLRRVLAERLAEAKDRFDAQSDGLKSEWHSAQDMPLRVLAAVARSADLIVAGGASDGRGEDYRRADTGELILTCGRPVLIAPPRVAELKGVAAVVAWKDAREARRALADSLPLLKRAERVVVLEVCRRDELEYATYHTKAVAEHLVRHGVVATAKVAAAPADEAAAEIRAAADGVGADLIVAGGYGHSRLGEWMFGGVTRELLREQDRFVLLSH